MTDVQFGPAGLRDLRSIRAHLQSATSKRTAWSVVCRILDPIQGLTGGYEVMVGGPYMMVKGPYLIFYLVRAGTPQTSIILRIVSGALDEVGLKFNR